MNSKLRSILLFVVCLVFALPTEAQIFLGDQQSGGGGGSGSNFTVNAGGNGTGTVTTLDGQINCVITAGVVTGTCSNVYSGSPSITVTATAGTNTSVAISAGTGSATGCSGSSNTLVSCTFTITQTSAINATFTTPAGSAIAGFYVGIDVNNPVTSCPPITGNYPANINHGVDRWWDLSVVQWATVMTGLTSFTWTKVDAQACAAYQAGAVIHWTMNRTPFFSLPNGSGIYPTDVGDSNYYTPASITGTGSSPNKITAISESGTTVTVTTTWHPTVGAQFVMQDAGGSAINGVWTVATSSPTQFTYTVSTAPYSGTVTLGSAQASTFNSTTTNAPGQADPPADVNLDGTGTDQTWRNWIGAAVSHVNAPGYLSTHAHVQVWESVDEPDTCGFFSCNFGSYDILGRWAADMYCIIKGGAYYIPGGVTSGTFTAGETITQTSTGATATLIGAPINNSDLMNLSAAPSGSPDSTHAWTGGSSGAVYTPTSAPTALTVPATGETCLQVRTAVAHGTSGANSNVVNTTNFPNFPSLPLDPTATVIMPSYHPPQGGQAQSYLYCGVPLGASSQASCSTGILGCGSYNGHPISTCCSNANGKVSCQHGGAALWTEAIDEHYKPGPSNTSPSMEPQMATAINTSIPAILATAEKAKPLYLPEAGYAACGWPTGSGCNSSSPWAQLQMEAAFLADYYVYIYSFGVPENIWYDYNVNNGGLGTKCLNSGTQWCANQAMTTAYNWLVGSTMSGCAISTGVAANSLYTCTLSSAYPGPSLTNAVIVWDNQEFCSGGSYGTLATSCPAETLNVKAAGSNVTKCWDVAGDAFTSIAGGNVQVTIMPQLCE